jgi:LuxR family transcriptional regulator of spore coat protein
VTAPVILAADWRQTCRYPQAEDGTRRHIQAQSLRTNHEFGGTPGYAKKQEGTAKRPPAAPLKGSDHKSKFLLTHREREVFELLVQDKTTKDIAQQLFISEKTVRNHISNVMQKLNVKGRSQAVVELIKLGELKI